MSLNDISPEFKNSKYILLHENSEGTRASSILNDEELQIYLSDGSVEDGDLIVKVEKISIIKIKHTATAEMVNHP